jgi:hypothetical protein
MKPMTHDRIDVARSDILRTAIDDLIRAVDEVEKSVLVDKPEVT